MNNYDRALTEVWEWREKVHQEFKDLSPDEYIRKLRKDSEQFLAEAGIQLKRVAHNKQYREFISTDTE